MELIQLDLSLIIGIIGAISGLLSLYFHLSRHIKERTSVKFELVKDSTLEVFDIYGSMQDEWGQFVQDKNKRQTGIRIELNIVNRSIHPITVYEISVPLGGVEHVLLKSIPEFHGRADRYTFKDSIFKLPLLIPAYGVQRGVLYFNLADKRPERFKVMFYTSRKKYVVRFSAPPAS